MKTVDSLTKGDYIAFGFNYHGGEPNEIIVDNITQVYEDKVLVHFIRGWTSLAEFVKKDKILAIRNSETGEGTIEGWSGKYDIINQKSIDEILERK